MERLRYSTPPGRADLLRKSYLFQRVSPRTMDNLAQGSWESVYQPEEPIFHQGDDADKLYIVTRGSVRLERQSSEGQMTALRSVHPMTPVGEDTLLNGGIHAATAAANEMTSMIVIPMTTNRLASLIANEPSMSIPLLASLVWRNWETVDLLREIRFLSSRARTAKALHELFSPFEFNGGNKHIRFLQIHLARKLGLKREILSKNLAYFTLRGAIDKKIKYRSTSLELVNADMLLTIFQEETGSTLEAWQTSSANQSPSGPRVK